MKSVRLITATLLATAGLVAVGTTQATAATGSTSLTVQYGAKVIKNEQFDVSGQLKTRYERQVKLQYKKGSAWKSLTSATASSTTGRFTFKDVTTSATRTYRFYAPASEGNGDESGKKIVGKAKKVTVVSQKGSGYVNPYPATYFDLGGSSHFNDTVYAVLSFSPARPGRAVSFTTPNGAPASGVQDSRGNVVIPFTLSKTEGSYPFTAKAAAKAGAAAKSTAPIIAKVEAIFYLGPIEF